MKNVVYIGRYLGMVGGIERYMFQSAQLLRDHGVRVNYLYTGEAARDEFRFAEAFDAVSRFSDGAEFLKQADLVILHKAGIIADTRRSDVYSSHCHRSCLLVCFALSDPVFSRQRFCRGSACPDADFPVLSFTGLANSAFRRRAQASGR